MATATIQSTRSPQNAPLGAAQATFETSTSWIGALITIPVACLVSYGFGSAWGWTVLVAIGFGAYLIAIAIYVTWVRASRLTCYEQGLVHDAITGSTTVLWDDVESISLSVRRPRLLGPRYAGTSHVITLTSRTTKRLKLGDQFNDPFAIWTHLIAATRNRLLARAEDDFAAGKTVDFGFVTFGREKGLTLMPLWRSPVTLPLDALTNYEVKGGDLRFWRKGSVGHIAVPIDCVPNVFVLLNMLDARTSNARAALLTVPDVYV